MATRQTQPQRDKLLELLKQMEPDEVFGALAEWSRDGHDEPLIAADEGPLSAIWASAQGLAAGDVDDVEAGLVAAESFAELLRRTERLVAESDGLLVFPSRQAAKLGIATADIEQIASTVWACNQLIAAGKLRLGASLKLESIAPEIYTSMLVAPTRGGDEYKIDLTVQWYGWRLWINKPLVQLIVKVTKAGGGVGAVVAALKSAGAIVSGGTLIVVAAAVALGGFVLDALDQCNGVYITWPWGSPQPIPWPA